LGYIKEIDASRLKSYDEKSFGSYKMGDFIGIGGVEELWDISLRGRDGFDQRVVNAIGREVIWPDIELIHEKPEDGASLKLTVDADLQVAAKEALAGKSGAVVAIDPRNGDVLALYSAPSIDLNRLSSSEGGAYWQKLAVDPEKPVYSRAIQGSYPPGSTYKIVTATSALGEKEITPTDNLFCGGGMNYGGRFYSCWRKGGHGSIDIKMALTASCDTFFYQLGLKLGVDRIAKYANLMGLGKITGIDVPGEKSGLIPTSAWKEETRKVKWQAGENLSIAVGQGYDTVTPLQNAVMISTIANGGKKVTPHVTSSVIDSTGKEIFRWSEEQFPQVLSEEDVNVIKRGLEGVVDSPFGTGNRLKALGLKIAGKTGTAQVVAKEVWRSGEAEMKDHAWFVGYAPYDNPVIAVAAVVEHGGFGASAAAPVVGKIIETYLKKENK
jgi:penicillin-binding protein 2